MIVLLIIFMVITPLLQKGVDDLGLLTDQRKTTNGAPSTGAPNGGQ